MIALLIALAVLPPAPTRGFILDEAGVLSPGATEVLNRQIKSLSDRGAGQVGILLTNDLRGMSRNELAPKVFKAWGIGYGDRGPTGKGRGLLILAKVSPPDRGVRVEVGSDLEGRLNDGKVGAIVREAIPDFAAGRWYDGLVHLVIAFGMEMQIEAADVAAPMRPAVRPEEPGWPWWAWALLLGSAAAIVGWVVWAVRRRKREPQDEAPTTTASPLSGGTATPGGYPVAVYDPVLMPVYMPSAPVVIEHHHYDSSPAPSHDYSPSYSSSDSSSSSFDSGSSFGSDSGGSFGGGGDSSGGGSDSSF